MILFHRNTTSCVPLNILSKDQTMTFRPVYIIVHFFPMELWTEIHWTPILHSRWLRSSFCSVKSMVSWSHAQNLVVYPRFIQLFLQASVLPKIWRTPNFRSAQFCSTPQLLAPIPESHLALQVGYGAFVRSALPAVVLDECLWWLLSKTQDLFTRKAWGGWGFLGDEFWGKKTGWSPVMVVGKPLENWDHSSL